MFDVNAVIKTAQEARAPKTIQIGERTYARPGEVAYVMPPQVNPLTTNSLQSVVDYWKATPDGEGERYIVCDWDSVEIVGKPDPQTQQRTVWLRALGATEWNERNVGRYLDRDAFVCWLSTAFAPGKGDAEGHLQKVIDIALHLKVEASVQGSGKGLSRAVATERRVGSQIKGEYEEPPNPLKLAPYRTFPEIDPVASVFTLVPQDQEGKLPLLGLFTSASSAWQAETRKLVKDWLKKELSDAIILG